MKIFVSAILSLFWALCLLAAPAVAQHIGSAEFQIRDSDGQLNTNFSLPPAAGMKLGALAAQMPVGNLKGDVTLYQFYDLNCPYCREAAADVDTLVRSDPKLKLVLVPYPVLSVASVQGALVEVGVSKSLSPEKYLDFHKRVYSGRGLIDGPRVLAAAGEFGLDKDKLAAASNTEATLNVLRANATFGSEAKLGVTPAYVIGGVAILGHPGLKPLQTVIAAMRKCGKVVC